MKGINTIYREVRQTVPLTQKILGAHTVYHMSANQGREVAYRKYLEENKAMVWLFLYYIQKSMCTWEIKDHIYAWHLCLWERGISLETLRLHCLTVVWAQELEFPQPVGAWGLLVLMPFLEQFFPMGFLALAPHSSAPPLSERLMLSP